MKITGLRARVYSHPLTRRLGDANLPQGFGTNAAVALFVETDDGLTGVSIGAPVIVGFLPTFEPFVTGEDPRSVRGLWQRMVDVAFKGDAIGPAALAISAIDCALWDLRAKANGVPLWKELGATRRRVKAYASGLDSPLDDEELATFYKEMAAQGIAAGKLKVGLDADADDRRLRIMHDALAAADPRPALMIDANEYWSPKQAIRRIRELERSFDLVWCEEPARRFDYRGLRQVSRAIDAAVATGENLYNVQQFRPLVEHEAVDVVQIGWVTTGITGALKVAELAYAFELPVAMMNCPANFMAHAAAVMPHHTMMEVIDAGTDRTFTADNRIVDGWIELGDEPGLGITFDEDALDAASGGQPPGDTIGGVYRRGAEAGVHEGSRPPKERD